MKDERPNILVIIPVYNEIEKIGTVVNELLGSGYRNIVVVDDGSDQNIAAELSNLSVYYLKHRVNLGQGAALQTGFDFAKSLAFDVVVTFDADGQHDSKDIALLAQPILQDEADLVFGSRFLNPKNRLPFTRLGVLQFARIVNYLFSGILLTDAHNGLRAFNAKSLRLINITENRMAHASEILYEVKRHDLRFCEVGVTIRYTSYSRRKGQSGWNSIRILFDLVLNRIFRSSTKP